MYLKEMIETGFEIRQDLKIYYSTKLVSKEFMVELSC